MASICAGESERSPAYWAHWSSGGQGGITPDDVASMIASFCAATPSKVVSENGAMPPAV